MSALLQPLELPRAARTLAGRVTLSGVGVHSGCRSTLSLHPVDTPGWWLVGQGGQRFRVEEATPHSPGWHTVVTLPDGTQMATLEHVLSMLNGLELDGIAVELEGEEAPILDGSAKPWCEAVEDCGIQSASWPARAWRLTAPVVVRGDEGAQVEARPSTGRSWRAQLVFDALPQDAQRAVWKGESSYRDEVSPARTFAFRAWVDKLRASGRIRGGSLECAVLFDQGEVVNAEGLRFANEPARHKILDGLGDLALLGAPLLADVTAYRPGHRIHIELLRTLRGGEFLTIEEKAHA